MAIRNAAAGLLMIFLVGVFYWLEVRSGSKLSTPVYWWIWAAVAAFVVLMCFAHAFLAAKAGGRRAGALLKPAVVIALAMMLFAVWWSVGAETPFLFGAALAGILFAIGWWFRPKVGS